MTYNLRVLKGRFAVCRVPEEAKVPSWATVGLFWQVMRAPGELTIVCAEHVVPMDVPSESGWYALEVGGPLSFDLSGVLHELLTPLADSGVVVITISGYSTDYLLVRDLEEALRALRNAGHAVC